MAGFSFPNGLLTDAKANVKRLFFVAGGDGVIDICINKTETICNQFGQYPRQPQ
jgi:hypothetical protein